MRKYLVPIILLSALGFLAGSPASAADLGTPVLSPVLVVRDRLNSGSDLKTGMRLEPMDKLIFEPQVGLGHAMWEREVRSGYDEITHTIHAQAGGKFDIFDVVSLTAVAKLPVYSVASSDRWLAGDYSQPGDFRHDILHSADQLSWKGEMGVRLGAAADINLFYDRSHFDEQTGSRGLSRFEETFGTRLIFRFK